MPARPRADDPQTAEDARRAGRTARAAEKKRAAEASFHREMQALDVKPLQPHGRHHRKPAHPEPHPVSRTRDDAEVLQASVSDDIDVESLLDTDEALSYRANGIGPDVLRKLRRGEWSIQSEIDLHGHRVDEAREALVAFLKQALKRNQRCVRVVHGKGLGSQGKTPVLKGKVRAWLVQRDDVIAFCQARPAEGGSGALVVLLRPTGNANPDKAC
ncbi:MAG: Smr/MutS family protein [Burkholderiaceae bacterium]|nr:Smr/MutS family protein [Burkholderiaceae bacterium]